ncbi:MAG: hypothetical protein HN542_06165 [Flavobacteriales bacterium]|jgi:hypothetical protein|nr:hypothetical protein [Flavobacteriales bacterium]NCG30845.1 hypothetical protein [Bacteroidota bacterium]MBT3962992.1 hypothetical protein [Flavobacteriales bacterium]MBT4703954.1 hypothetical protein [Flavobacteriales bacterium]MBT4930350.1 hypothetical protein [Flavobacteriales bacterium]
MNRWLLVGLVAISLLLIFGVWYKVTFSMDRASGFEIGTEDAEVQILIVYQGSPYKNRMIEIITEHYFISDVFLKGIDIEHLDLINPNHWDAVMLIHTWEVWQPPEEIERFINAHYDPLKMVVHTTSGNGNRKMDSVDALTSASVIDSVYTDTKRALEKLDSLIHR